MAEIKFADLGKMSYKHNLRKEEYVSNSRIRPEGQDIFDWLSETQLDINDKLADGTTWGEVFKNLR